MVAAAEGQEVPGELFRVDDACLAVLDAFEDHPHLFRRTPVLLASAVEAETYLYAKPTSDDTASCVG